MVMARTDRDAVVKEERTAGGVLLLEVFLNIFYRRPRVKEERTAGGVLLP
jgi:hypothetical protein